MAAQQVQIRYAQYSDLPAIAHVMTQAFFDDDLFGDIIHPYRKQHHADVQLYWLRRARVNYWNYRWRWPIAVMQEAQTGREVIVGTGQWERIGPGGDKMECRVYDPRESLLDSVLSKGLC